MLIISRIITWKILLEDAITSNKSLSNREINELIDIALENKDYARIDILKKYLK